MRLVELIVVSINSKSDLTIISKRYGSVVLYRKKLYESYLGAGMRKHAAINIIFGLTLLALLYHEVSLNDWVVENRQRIESLEN
jgi:hypothetical protein